MRIINQNYHFMGQVSNLQSKPHYAALDGLRGVAAVIVVIFHLFEAHSTNHLDQLVNHGYLAVDFFFVLSGFVVGYAYDDRWNQMSLKDFFRRRLIRLQPMIVLGGLIGAILFYFGEGKVSPNIAESPIELFLIAAVAGCLLIPLTRSFDVRGWDEMYPVNGPEWSLFYEYLANVLYALFIRRFSNLLLFILVLSFGSLTIHFLMTNSNGDMVGGWALNGEQIQVGFIRLLYPFFAGLLLSRLKWNIRIPHPFFWCSISVIILLCMPRIGGEKLWLNGIYEAACILILFPLIVVLGSSDKKEPEKKGKLCHLLGKISYPLYLTHYPFVYLYFEYIKGGNPPSAVGAWGWGIAITLFCIIAAYFYERFYETPVRRWLNRKK